FGRYGLAGGAKGFELMVPSAGVSSVAPCAGPCCTDEAKRTNPSAHLQVQPATSLGRIKGRHFPHDLVPEHQDAPSALSSQGRLARSGTALRFWCQGGLPSSLFVTSSPWRARAATTDSGMPHGSRT